MNSKGFSIIRSVGGLAADTTYDGKPGRLSSRILIFQTHSKLSANVEENKINY